MGRSSLAYTVVASRRVGSINMVWPDAPARVISLVITPQRTKQLYVRSKSHKRFSRQDAKAQRVLIVDFHRFSQIGSRIFHRRDAEYAKGRIFAQSGDDDWAKTFSSNLRNVFVCRRLPTNKKLILCALCASAVRFLKNPIFLQTWRALRLCESHLILDFGFKIFNLGSNFRDTKARGKNQ